MIYRIENGSKQARLQLEIIFTKRVSAPEAVLFRELEGESVLLNVDSESYFGLDDVGTRIWLVLTESDSIQAAYDTLKDEYNVEPELLRRDLIELIEKLNENGLVRIDDASTALHEKK